MVKKSLVLAVSVFALSLSLFAVNPPAVSANGNGSPVECSSNPNKNPANAANVMGGQSGSQSQMVVNVPAGKVVEGVCIKTGSQTFFGLLNSHSGVITLDGSYGNRIHPQQGNIGPCYSVVGIGTTSVTVTRLNASCQGISHIDVIFAAAPVVPGNPGNPGTPTTPTPTPGQTLGTSTQVEAPVAAVNAGGAMIAPALALVGSAATLGYGILRLRKATR